MKGIGVSPGLAIGKAFIIEEQVFDFPEGLCKDTAYDLIKYQNAVQQSVKEIEALKQKALISLGEENARIFDAHIEIAKDPQMIKEIEQSINKGMYAMTAVQEVTDKYIAMFGALEDQYFRERSADIEDVQKRLYRNIMGLKEINLEILPENTIIVSKDLTPSETTLMDKNNVVGLLTEVGGETSHTAIIARNLGIPAVMGISGATNDIEDNTMLFMDGSKGTIEMPHEDAFGHLQEQIKAQQEIKAQLDRLKFEEAITRDGHKVDVFCNIGNPEEATAAVNGGAEGVGLFRTEFLYMQGDHFPTEEEQYQAYKASLENMDGRPIIFRTLDVGGDKEIPYFDLPSEMNPFLGWRAIRIFFDRKDLFMTQIRALMRASQHGEVWIMMPMISSIDEIIKAKSVFVEAKDQLLAEGVAVEDNLKVGIMVEIPSVAVIADKVAEHVDFMSIGTNDLTQYTLACDRINEKVKDYYDTFQPGVLHLINNVIKAGDNETIVGMCGELAGNPLATLLLLGMGLNEFSMSPSSVPKIKKIVRSVTYEYAKAVADKVLAMHQSKEIQAYLIAELEALDLGYLLEV